MNLAGRRWASAIALLGILGLYVLHVVYLNCVVEDAYITFRYARHAEAGLGFVWNPAGPPVEGYTNFLWLLVMAAAMRLGVDVVPFSQIAGTACGASTIVLSYVAARRLAGWPRRVALVPPLLLAASGPFATWSGSGLETVPFASLVFAGVCAFGWYWRTDRARWLAVMGLALTAATLMRPEGALVLAVLAGLAVVLSFGDFRWRLGHLAILAAAWGAPFALYFAWRYSYFGYPLPNTFYAKTGGGRGQIERGLLTSAQFGWQFGLPLIPAALVAAWESGVTGRRPLGLATIIRESRRHAFLVASVVLTVVYTAYIVAVGNDYMAMHRFFVPVLPLLYVAGALAFAVLARSASAWPRRLVIAALVIMATAGTAIHSLPIERHFVAESTQQHGNHRGVQTARHSVERLLLIGRFFAGYRRSSAESLATDAIGAIGYATDLDIYDFHGLVDVHIAHLPIGVERAGMTGHQKADYSYTIGLKPTYIMIGRELTSRSGDIERFAPPGIFPDVLKDYVVQSVWLNDDANHAAGYFSFLERRDR